MSGGLDRSAINTALAKAIAYHQCDRPDLKREWVTRLVELLEAADILKLDHRSV